MRYRCRTDLRRTKVTDAAELNGIDFLEVLDDPAQPLGDRQRTLFLHFVKPLAPAVRAGLTPAHVRVDGGERIRGIQVTAVRPTDDDDVLAVLVDRAGDFSTYTLRLAGDPDGAAAPEGIDEILASVEFSFKVECDSHFDCLATPDCPPEGVTEPVVDYLAKDYASFRRLLLDRLALLLPGWTERSPADIGVVLAELLAYVGDYLSYTQDAVATEAYLGTARRRVSVRRHVRLVDYPMHDGRNARTWVQVQVGQDIGADAGGDPLPAGTQFLTVTAGLPAVIARDGPDHRRALAAGAVAFETVGRLSALYQAHNRMPFHTWDGLDCVLPAGSVAATLRGHYPRLRPGDVLVLAEQPGPGGRPGRADPRHRHPVRLTEVRHNGPMGEPLTDPLNGVAITEIRWHPRDALPFPLCVAATADDGQGEPAVEVEDVAVALGNVVLADHGATLDGARHGELLGPVPGPALRFATDGGCGADGEPVPPRFRPQLRFGPVTQAAAPPPDPAGLAPEQLPPAADALVGDLGDALPAIELTDDTAGGGSWRPLRDLLASDATAQRFVAEVEDDGTATLRFGDGTFGQAPPEGAVFIPRYRTGNGRAGNIGADSLGHLVQDRASARLAGVVDAVVNPLPAVGGTDPETIEEVRQRAPFAFRGQARAVTPDDYARAARSYPSEQHPEVQQAIATFRWTGSWYTVFVTVDRLGGLDVDRDFKARLRAHLERFRLAGHDLEIEGPRYVPLEVTLAVRVRQDYFRGDVEQALLGVLSSRVGPDGRKGLFHPDNFTFGQPVHLSPVLAAAQSVAGVASVDATRFGRLGSEDPAPLAEQRLTLGRLEIARLDNDPNFPDRGVLRLQLDGGR